MSKAAVLEFALILLYAAGVRCFPGGAPSDACTTLSPNPTFHGADPQPASTIPYMLDGFDEFEQDDGTFGYEPGRTYRCKFVGQNITL